MKVVIIGCGRIGAHVARSLAAAGHQVCVVDHDPGSFTRLGSGFGGRTVIGPGFDQAVLEQAQVAQADAVAVLTNLDTANFMVARAVTVLFGVGRITVRVNDPEFSSVFAELGLDTVNVPDLVLERIRAGLPCGGEDA